jgi:glycosyltransferase involved in cell wall biosynthesis
MVPCEPKSFDTPVNSSCHQPPAKILFASPATGLGGSERVLITLLTHLDRARFEPHLAVARAKGLLYASVPTDVKVHALEVDRARHAVLPLIRLCWQLRPKVVFTMSAHLNSVVIIAKPLLPRGIRLIAREGTQITLAEVTPNRIRLAAYKWLYRNTDAVVCQSDHMREQLMHAFGLGARQAIRIYNPVDVDMIRSLADVVPDPFEGPGPNLLAVGRFYYEKNFELMLRAMALVRKEVPTARLTIVGGGAGEQQLMALRQQLGLEDTVSFTGLRVNPYPWMKHTDALLLSSRYEGLPNTVLEAVALGKPVVITDCCGALKEIISTGARLTVVPEATPEAFSGAVVQLLRHLEGKRREVRPSAAFLERFGLKSVLADYEVLLQRAVGEPEAASPLGSQKFSAPDL